MSTLQFGIPAELPRVYCPACRGAFELSDPYNIDEGSPRDCPKCGAHLEAVDVETIKSCRWQVRDEEDI